MKGWRVTGISFRLSVCRPLFPSLAVRLRAIRFPFATDSAAAALDGKPASVLPNRNTNTSTQLKQHFSRLKKLGLHRKEAHMSVTTPIHDCLCGKRCVEKDWTYHL